MACRTVAGRNTRVAARGSPSGGGLDDGARGFRWNFGNWRSSSLSAMGRASHSSHGLPVGYCALQKRVAACLLASEVTEIAPALNDSAATPWGKSTSKALSAPLNAVQRGSRLSMAGFPKKG
ncbi:MAG: hypothetical protein RLY70_3977 [Planctomycetota bacterium]|jgi:hypothetical protein